MLGTTEEMKAVLAAALNMRCAAKRHVRCRGEGAISNATWCGEACSHQIMERLTVDKCE